MRRRRFINYADSYCQTRLRRNAPRPSRPAPSNAIEAGSGVAVAETYWKSWMAKKM
jgi:hypothetical protein